MLCCSSFRRLGPADPAKRARIEQLALLLRSVLDARKRLMLTFNCPADKLESMLAFLPA